MEKQEKFCQSCGMPLKKDPKNGGTEANGSVSLLYCSYCFADGNFTRPDITVNEMKALVKGKMKEMGFPGFLAGFFTYNLPRLKRWKEK